MVIIFLDLVGSTERMRRNGTDLASGQIREQLSEWLSSISRFDPSVLQIKNPAGDGLLLVGTNASRILAATIQRQAVPGYLQTRVALGNGDPQWEGEEWHSDSNIRGTIVNLTARLLSVCPPSGVVVTEGIKDAVLEQPELISLLHRCQADLKGLGIQTYWSTSPAEEKAMDNGELGKIQKAIGTLEGTVKTGFKNLDDRMDRMHEGLYGKAGLEPRVRDTEKDLHAMKKNSGLIALFVSVTTNIAGWFYRP